MEPCWSTYKVPIVGIVECLLPAGHEHLGRKHYHAKKNDPEVWWTWWDEQDHKPADEQAGQASTDDLRPKRSLLAYPKVEVTSFFQMTTLCYENDIEPSFELSHRYMVAKRDKEKFYFIPAWRSFTTLQED